MTRLKKELMKRHIVFEADEYACMKGAEYDDCRVLVDIKDNFIITAYYSMVLDPEFHIFDRHTMMQIAVQQVYPEKNPCLTAKYINRWYSHVCEEPVDPEYAMAI